jgi:hypothetical protein
MATVLYKETTSTSSGYHLARLITFSNEGAEPSVTIVEAVKTTTDDGTVHLCDIGQIFGRFNPENGSFPLLNPETGEAVGTMSHAELYVALYSLYLSLATDRDNGIVQNPRG